MFARRGYLLDVTRRMPTERTFRLVLDLLAACDYNEFFLHSDAETSREDAPDLARVAAYARMQGIDFAETDRASYAVLLAEGATVAVSTEAPRSLAGRVEEMRERMQRAEEAGRRAGATRFLVTDFSDECAWQPLAASLPGIVLGGNFAMGGRKAARMDLELELNRFLDAPLGGHILKLGTLYLRGGAVRDDASELFNILSHDHGYSRHPGITDAILEEIGGIAHGVRIAAERWTDRTDWAKEIVYMADLVDAACHRRDERRLRALRDTHGRLWRLRFVEDGRAESLARLPRF